VVLDKLRERLHNEPQVVTQLKAKQFTSEAQKKALVDKFVALTEYEPEHVAWAAADPAPELRQAAMALLKRYPDQKLVLAALTPLLRTRSEAQRRGVQRFIQELAGADFPRVVAELSEGGDDFVLVACLDVAKDLPPDVSYRVFKRSLMDGGPQLRARALKALAEGGFKGPAERVSGLALPLLSDENEELRLGALGVLEKNPTESLIPAVLQVARSGGGRIAEAAFATLKRLIALAKTDHTDDILPLLADANPVVRAGAAGLLAMVPPQALVNRFLVQFNGAYVWVRDRALEAAGQYMPNFLPLLLQQISNPDPAVAAGAKEMALVINDARGVPAWMHLLRTETDWWTRHRSIEGLRKPEAETTTSRARSAPSYAIPTSSSPRRRRSPTLGDRRAAAAVRGLQGGERPWTIRWRSSTRSPSSPARCPTSFPRWAPSSGKVAAHTAIDPVCAEGGTAGGPAAGRRGGGRALPSVVAAPSPSTSPSTRNPRLVDYLRDTMARGGPTSTSRRGSCASPGRRRPAPDPDP
jgi:HEAT repeat protein